MKFSSLTIIFLVVLSCNSKENSLITKAEDYNAYLPSKAPKTTSKYFELWNAKIKPDSIQITSFGIVAGQYEAYFKATGDISYLKKSEQALEKAVAIAATGRAGYRRALARNYIAQHRFKEALVQAKEARAIGSGLRDTQNLLFDVHMELGNYTLAQNYLDSITDITNFDFLIRAAKWNDYKGDLATTINYMEQAKDKAEKTYTKALILWSYTNLADYYGHAGRLSDSYKYYLKSLALDAENAYAKKGIAWIVFSHEKNPKEALRILDSVTKNYHAPDYYLLKAEIAAYMDNTEMKLLNIDEYIKSVKNTSYGEMYNGYTINLHLEETKQWDKALELAKREVNNRPTPESYHFLASSYLKLGQKKKALAIVTEHIEGKSYEPALLFTCAEIYKANGLTKKANALKTELLGAVYELGPSSKEKIESL